eukprot:TRINITY_DN11623_c2_g1_i1.p1 TRINITY_DN11623_c2_g1~~TRINITY_DN11623_c2_g1_i1.p1  ORF type:complete len:486 (-),score=53.63 TRINITY_DN11623_c2_g1_i1:429-1829(-)
MASVVRKEFGNPFCWISGITGFTNLLSYDECCDESTGQERCWAKVNRPQDSLQLSHETCCFSGLVHFMQRASHVNLQMLINSWLAMKFAFDENAFTLATYSGPHEPLFGVQFDGEGCLREHGARFLVNASIYELNGTTWFFEFGYCAPRFEDYARVATTMVPSYLSSVFGSLGRDVLFGSAEMVSLDNSYLEHRLGTSLGVPPASNRDMLEYLRLFRVCASCDLMRLGDDEDGGYLMCRDEGLRPSDGTSGEGRLVAAYSYGINGADAWGSAVSRRFGVEVHQYDCFDTRVPLCEAPCRSRFHAECLGVDPESSPSPSSHTFNALAVHLQRNGHIDVTDGQLLLKVDIEGSEWDVFSSLDEGVLRKFRQIVVEFHQPHLMTRCDAKTLQKRVMALLNILQVFSVVHVHPNQFYGYLEVSFVNRAFIDPSSCRKPVRNVLDTAYEEDSPKNPVEDLFGQALEKWWWW